MNNLYFACIDCKEYVDAGYRWAYWELEVTCFVVRGEPVDPEYVQSAEAYWNPPPDDTSRWLIEEVLPSVRDFLNRHQTHRIIFDEEEGFLSWEGDSFMDWLQVGFLADESPRYWAEVLGFSSWEQVYAHVRSKSRPPWWWDLIDGGIDFRAAAIRRFEELARPKKRK